MKDSSQTTDSAFNQLTFKQINVLLQCLQKSGLASRSHIKRIYSEKEQGFEGTLAFFIRLGIVKEFQNSIEVSNDWLKTNKEELKEQLIVSLTRVRNRYRSELYNFLIKFQFENRDLCYRSSEQVRSKESAVRNFLMQMGIVNYDLGTEKYIIPPAYVSLYLKSLDGANQKSPSALKKQLIAKDEIGFMAEKVILEYEIGRLDDCYAKQIVHVALQNVAAGFDIRSFNVNQDDSISPRFIEVKAVSIQTYQFFWTSNEVKMARKLRDWYYLYLLPIRGTQSFDLKHLKIIPNPYKAIIEQPVHWTTESDVFRCYLKKYSQK